MASFFGQNEEHQRDAYVALLELRPGQLVLDVGSGPGSSLGALGRAGARTVCLDYEPALLDGIRPAVVGDALQLPIATSAVDAALAVGLVHAVWNVRGLLTELVRVVRPGGRVVVVNKGLAPWLQESEWYTGATQVLGLDAQQWPPIGLLPADATDVSLRWLFDDAFYAIAFRKDAREHPG